MWLIRDPSEHDADEVVAALLARKRSGDVAVATLHWGSNWGSAVAPNEIQVAHGLVDGGVDIVHGHSSHHPRPIGDLQWQTDPVWMRGCHRRL